MYNTPVCIDCQIPMIIVQFGIWIHKVSTDGNPRGMYYANLWICPTCKHKIATLNPTPTGTSRAETSFRHQQGKAFEDIHGEYKGNFPAIEISTSRKDIPIHRWESTEALVTEIAKDLFDKQKTFSDEGAEIMDYFRNKEKNHEDTS